jgi:transposase
VHAHGVSFGLLQIADNAPTHRARDMLRVLTIILDAMGVRLVLLPKYSPELNPCELIFAQVKRYLREERQNGDFVTEISRGFGRVSRVNVFQYYERCLLHYDE